jgi:glutathione S-transferase
MGEIPVLEEDGRKLTQTGPIRLQLAERCGRFGGRDEAELFEVLRWLFLGQPEALRVHGQLSLPTHVHEGRRTKEQSPITNPGSQIPNKSMPARDRHDENFVQDYVARALLYRAHHHLT